MSVGLLYAKKDCDFNIGTDGDEVMCKLRTTSDVHGDHPIEQCAFFQHDVNLVAVGGGSWIQIDHQPFSIRRCRLRLGGMSDFTALS